jgi:hypothetical protein
MKVSAITFPPGLLAIAAEVEFQHDATLGRADPQSKRVYDFIEPDLVSTKDGVLIVGADTMRWEYALGNRKHTTCATSR